METNIIEQAELYKKGLKRCTRCGEVKKIDEFYRFKGSPDGHESVCAACTLEARNGFNRRKSAATERGLARLAYYSDDALYNELYRRGYRGQLMKPSYIGTPLTGETGEMLGQ